MRRIALGVAVLVASAAAATATAAAQAPPRTTSPPTIEGTFVVGQTVSAGNGGWANNPTSFAYQWQRCSSSGTGCVDIAGATSKSYKLTSADAGHRLLVLVTASNADGKATANSHPSPVIVSGAPRNTSRPVISGNAQSGEVLTVSNGSWSGGVSSFSYQWRLCNALGADCANIAGATGRTYTVRTSDVGHTLRAAVTARNAAGAATAVSDATAEVTEGTNTTTVTTTQTNAAPTVRLLSLRVTHNRVFVRIRVCDDSFGRVTLIVRDQLVRRLAYTRRFSVSPTPCGTFARNWLLIPRFRAHGRYTVTVRALDQSRKLSRLAVRSIRL